MARVLGRQTLRSSSFSAQSANSESSDSYFEEIIELSSEDDDEEILVEEEEIVLEVMEEEEFVEEEYEEEILEDDEWESQLAGDDDEEDEFDDDSTVFDPDQPPLPRPSREELMKKCPSFVTDQNLNGSSEHSMDIDGAFELNLPGASNMASPNPKRQMSALTVDWEGYKEFLAEFDNSSEQLHASNVITESWESFASDEEFSVEGKDSPEEKKKSSAMLSQDSSTSEALKGEAPTTRRVIRTNSAGKRQRPMRTRSGGLVARTHSGGIPRRSRSTVLMAQSTNLQTLVEAGPSGDEASMYDSSHHSRPTPAILSPPRTPTKEAINETASLQAESSTIDSPKQDERIPLTIQGIEEPDESARGKSHPTSTQEQSEQKSEKVRDLPTEEMPELPSAEDTIPVPGSHSIEAAPVENSDQGDLSLQASGEESNNHLAQGNESEQKSETVRNLPTEEMPELPSAEDSTPVLGSESMDAAPVENSDLRQGDLSQNASGEDGNDHVAQGNETTSSYQLASDQSTASSDLRISDQPAESPLVDEISTVPASESVKETSYIHEDQQDTNQEETPEMTTSTDELSREQRLEFGAKEGSKALAEDFGDASIGNDTLETAAETLDSQPIHSNSNSSSVTEALSAQESASDTNVRIQDEERQPQQSSAATLSVPSKLPATIPTSTAPTPELDEQELHAIEEPNQETTPPPPPPDKVTSSNRADRSPPRPPLTSGSRRSIPQSPKSAVVSAVDAPRPRRSFQSLSPKQLNERRKLGAAWLHNHSSSGRMSRSRSRSRASEAANSNSVASLGGSRSSINGGSGHSRPKVSRFEELLQRSYKQTLS